MTRTFESCRAVLIASIVLIGACSVAIDPPLPDRERYAELPQIPDASFWPEIPANERLDQLVTVLRRAREPVTRTATGERVRIVGADRAGSGAVVTLRAVDSDGELVAPDAPPEMRFSNFASYGVGDTSVEQLVVDDARAFRWIEPNGAATHVAVLIAGEDADSADTAVALESQLLTMGFAVLATSAPRIPLEVTEFRAASMKAVTQKARELAQAIDQTVASEIYAIESMLQFCVGKRAALRTLPLALVGVTEGAAIVPALSLRLHGRVHGVALIGGGADLFALDASREPTDRRVVLEFSGEAEEEDGVRWFHDVYARDARLDPYAASVWLRATRTAVVDFEDEPCGDTLFRRLDRPLRMQLGADRSTLLRGVRMKVDELLDFLVDDAAYRGEKPKPPPPVEESAPPAEDSAQPTEDPAPPAEPPAADSSGEPPAEPSETPAAQDP
jgi:hypothetical protein